MHTLLKRIAVGVVLVVVASCTTQDPEIVKKCKDLGYKKGTDAYATCMTNQRISKENQFIFKYDRE